MSSQTDHQEEKRKKGVRFKIRGTNKKPRLCVFRANRYIYAQLIDDFLGKTLLAVNERMLGGEKVLGKTKREKAKIVGQVLAQKALALKIKTVVFDRGAYRYHGRVKALAEGARQEGLEF